MAEHTRVMTIRCPSCRKKLLKYLKIGKGRLVRCYKDRIKEDHTVRQGEEVLCPCGHRLAWDAGDHLKVLGSFRLD